MAYFKQSKNSALTTLYVRLTCLLEKYVSPLLLLMARLWVAQAFWYPGVLKSPCERIAVAFSNSPSPNIACFSQGSPESFSTGLGLLFSLLLVLGLGTRLTALPLFILIALLRYPPGNSAFYLTFLLGFIFCYGPGPLSLDYFFWKRYKLKANKIF